MRLKMFSAVVLLTLPLTAAAPMRWGFVGHEISGRAAATNLPAALPAFFRTATEQMAYLNPEPDRWRGDGFRELNEAMRYDHYVDFEAIPDTLMRSLDRFVYLTALRDARLTNPARDAGLLPFRIVEMYQGLVVEWRLWRRETNPAKKRMIEQRILNDAGILGHYVTDGANPHHTSVHHNGWAQGYPNPRNFRNEANFHSRFESIYVENNIRQNDITPLVNRTPRTITDVRADVMNYLQRSHSRLNRLYELDVQEAYGANTRGAAHREFAIERLVAGANMLRDLWWSAYVQSGVPEPQR